MLDKACTRKWAKLATKFCEHLQVHFKRLQHVPSAAINDDAQWIASEQA